MVDNRRHASHKSLELQNSPDNPIELIQFAEISVLRKKLSRQKKIVYRNTLKTYNPFWVHKKAI